MSKDVLKYVKVRSSTQARLWELIEAYAPGGDG